MSTRNGRFAGRFICALVAAAGLITAVDACAQAFPTKTVKLVVPFPPGGPGDLVARAINGRLSALLGQPVIVENKVGASAIIGAEYVARSEPDGHTLLVASLPVLSINPLQFAKLPYAPEKDLVAVAVITTQPYLVAVRSSVPANNFAELVALARKDPGKLSFGSSSSSIYLATELLSSRAGIKLGHVPYKGSGPALNDLLGGHIDLLLETFSTLSPHARSGKIKVLMITSPSRNDLAPEVPSYTEAGLKDMTITSWQAIVAPTGTPRRAIDALNEALNTLLKSPEIVAALKQYGVMPVGGTPAESAAFIGRESELWRSIARQVNLVPGSM